MNNENWFTWLIIPIVIGVTANLLTPLFRRLLSSFIFSVKQSLNIAGKKVIQKRIGQLNSELKQVINHNENPTIYISYLGQHFSFQFMMLWAFIIAYGVIFLYFKDANSDFAPRILGALIGSGGIQAIISLFISWNYIDEMKTPEKYIASIEKKLEEMQSA